MKKILELLSVAAFVFICSVLSSAPLDKPEVKYTSECFSGMTSEYSSFIQTYLTKQESKFKNEEMKQRYKAKLQAVFSKEKFNIYRESLSCQSIKYKVDDVWVSGFVIYPKKTNIEKLPVIIANRGGNARFGRITFGTMLANLFPLAAEGFVVIGSQYRLQDEFGGRDLDDVAALYAVVANIEQADVSRIGMFGASRGGMQTFMLARNEPRIKAIVTIAAVTDLELELKFRPAMEKVYKARIPNYGSNKIAELSERSVMHWVEKVDSKLPILLLHGENDKRVSVNNSIHFAELLKEQSRPHKLIIYPEDNHILSKNKTLALKEITDWFKKYL